MDLSRRLSALANALATHVHEATIGEFRDFIAAGEFGVAVEFLCDRLSDDEEPLRLGEAREIREFADELRLSRPSIDDLDELVVRDW